jgi:hypothetical protein
LNGTGGWVNSGAVSEPLPSLSPSATSKAERVYGELRRRIRELALPPGAPLRKEDIALEMGVSRAPHLAQASRSVERELAHLQASEPSGT